MHETAQQIEKLGQQTKVQVVDVSDAKQAEEASRSARAGGFTVRAVVAAAGIVRLDSLRNPDPVSAQQMMAVNVDGVYNTLQDLVAGGSESSALIVGSTEGFKGAPALNTYCRSKAAVLGIARAAALELGPLGVRVNTIQPGTIRTPMYQPEKMGPGACELATELQRRTPLRRVGQPEEVAKVARFLISADASYNLTS
ncbi:hypothetical protein N7468_004485 [Penicillium chermesinum]|uniref:Uncharacterized protein n=1 Tax=Penicillium chermesinum TaxID=63820 RepID=A0A9W9P8E2_9EURO|nr:uncharacterized protein N7468_004485 [Penicillium chermesinum]KAJ5239866.1 hypothetical protein N7468_004485 [Penicillium chermesinum]KAJ6166746.1 hypothetical protein N7470_002193 [Penicillium chermesinum]